MHKSTNNFKLLSFNNIKTLINNFIVADKIVPELFIHDKKNNSNPSLREIKSYPTESHTTANSKMAPRMSCGCIYF